MAYNKHARPNMLRYFLSLPEYSLESSDYHGITPVVAEAVGSSTMACNALMVKLEADRLMWREMRPGGRSTRAAGLTQAGVTLATELAQSMQIPDPEPLAEPESVSQAVLTPKQAEIISFMERNNGLILSGNGSLFERLAREVNLQTGSFLNTVWYPLRHQGLVADNGKPGYATTAGWLVGANIDPEQIPGPINKLDRGGSTNGAKPSTLKRKPPLDPTTPIGRVHLSLIRGGLTVSMLTIQVNVSRTLPPLDEDEVEASLDELVAKRRAVVIYDGLSQFGRPLKEWKAA